jgi:hypothetical protein
LLLTVLMRLLVQILPRGASISDLICTMGITSQLQYVFASCPFNDLS